MIFNSMGMSYPTYDTILPAQFSIGIFVLYIFLSAVLPGICEEMVTRGITLTAIRGTFKEWQTIVLGGLVFGLFHQFIYQTYYTAAFGALLVFIALRTRSIIPCMIIHFTNNLLSVVSEFADFYHWQADVSLFGLIESITSSNLLTIILLFVGLAILALLVWALIKIVRAGDKKKVASSIGLPADQVKYLNVEVLGGPLGNTVYYKPVFKDTIFYWGALIVSVLTTVFSVVLYLV
jgi:ABC-type Fe3+-siderophore transport system permease subunit